MTVAEANTPPQLLFRELIELGNLERAEVVGTPLANQVFSLVDSLWLTEPRLEGIRALDTLAHSRI
jgi:hypothetical protein